MKIYTFKRVQLLPASLPEAWEFFSSPGNLQKITPTHMKFEIRYFSGGEKMYPGQIIRYKINILPAINVNWVTEITHVREPFYFVDEQRLGPYALWHHQHHFRETAGGVEMADEVNYAIPLGFMGTLAHHLFVRKKVKGIFDYRYDVLKDIFQNRVVSV